MRQFDRYSGSTGAVMLLLVLLAGCSKEKPEQFELPSLGASGPVTVSGHQAATWPGSSRLRSPDKLLVPAL